MTALLITLGLLATTISAILLFAGIKALFNQLAPEDCSDMEDFCDLC